MQNEYRIKVAELHAECLAISQKLDKLEKELATRYPLDDGPLTDAQIETIRELSDASDIPQENFNRSIFPLRYPLPGAYL